ncbi:MAG: hypothetical protein LBB38_02490, partial [Puniceicoccales bacterium]|nr:hypothetical protein [Puniceicoccales bacterium]
MDNRSIGLEMVSRVAETYPLRDFSEEDRRGNNPLIQLYALCRVSTQADYLNALTDSLAWVPTVENSSDGHLIAAFALLREHNPEFYLSLAACLLSTGRLRLRFPGNVVCVLDAVTRTLLRSLGPTPIALLRATFLRHAADAMFRAVLFPLATPEQQRAVAYIDTRMRAVGFVATLDEYLGQDEGNIDFFHFAVSCCAGDPLVKLVRDGTVRLEVLNVNGGNFLRVSTRDVGAVVGEEEDGGECVSRLIRIDGFDANLSRVEILRAVVRDSADVLVEDECITDVAYRTIMEAFLVFKGQGGELPGRVQTILDSVLCVFPVDGLANANADDRELMTRWLRVAICGSGMR